VRVVGLPSQTCYSEKKLTETSNVVRASVPTILGAPCLVCLLGNGHLIANSLPSLRPLMDVDYMPLVDFRQIRTFQCSNHGQAVYFCSPSELQKITLSSEMSNDLNDMLADLYIPCDLPEPPKKNFLEKFAARLQSTGSSSLARPPRGKASAGICKLTRGPNMEGVQARAAGASSEIGLAMQKAMERGEKLSEVDEQTERMKNSAEQHRNVAGQLAQKYKDKDKKWWPF
uniref:V-SNARE coiled-coil homology domain-containing protein n=1 Tax=Macrostomum lignano TaxID=282301 RepID=A0A1I8I8I2_9PLAT